MMSSFALLKPASTEYVSLLKKTDFTTWKLLTTIEGRKYNE